MKRLNNEKGLTTVVATILMVLLVFLAVGIVWGFIHKTVKDQTEGVGTCFDIETSNKIKINDDYTCYDSANGEFQFSISVEDVDIDSLLISVSTEEDSISFVLASEEQVVSGLKPYKGSYGELVGLPGKNAGLTYVASGFSGDAEEKGIQIAPVVDGKQCGVTDENYEILDCSFFN